MIFQVAASSSSSSSSDTDVSIYVIFRNLPVSILKIWLATKSPFQIFRWTHMAWRITKDVLDSSQIIYGDESNMTGLPRMLD
jgi:hypothetical protein